LLAETTKVNLTSYDSATFSHRVGTVPRLFRPRRLDLLVTIITRLLPIKVYCQLAKATHISYISALVLLRTIKMKNYIYICVNIIFIIFIYIVYIVYTIKLSFDVV
jgi:hypothetical protein